MKKVFLVILFLLGCFALGYISSARAENWDVNKDTKEDLCGVYAENAVHGFINAVRGINRQVQFVSREHIMELIEHDARPDGQLVMIDPKDPPNPETMDFYAQGLQAGYDYAQPWADDRTKQLPSSASVWERFQKACLSERGA